MQVCKSIFLTLKTSSILFLVLFYFAACDTNHRGHEKLDNTAAMHDDHTGHDHVTEKHDDHNDHIPDKNDDHDGHDHEVEKPDDHDSHDHDEDKHELEGESAGHEEHEDHTGHDHAAHASGMDLDKSVEELFAANCEHDAKTHQCEECRYEVGVVKVPRKLIDRGLISVSKLARRNFDSEIELTGEIQFDQQKIAHLGPRVAGVVRQVKVDIGDKVKAGRTLLVLESVELAEAQADYLEALARRQLAQKTYDRQKALLEKKFTSEMDYLESQQEYESVKIRVNSAKQKLLRMGLSSGALSRLAKKGHSAATGRLPVAAPFSGEVLELHAARGELVEPGDEMILFGDVSTLWVWIDLYESQLAAVKSAMSDKGLPVRILVRAWPGEDFSGRMDYVGNMMDEHTRTIKARILLANPHGKLKPGMFAKVALGLDSTGGKIAAPVTAVVSDEGRDFVFVRHEGDYFVRRPVTKGMKTDAFVELVDGVQEGQFIVTAGAFLLKSDVLRAKMGEGCAH